MRESELAERCRKQAEACCDPELRELLLNCAEILAHPGKGAPCATCHLRPAEVGAHCRPCYQRDRRASRI